MRVECGDFLGEDLAAKDVHHLQGACAVDHELAVADVGEALRDFVGGFLVEYQPEAGGIVAILRIEGVTVPEMEQLIHEFQ